MFAESITLDPTEVILLLAAVLLVFVGLIAAAIYGMRIAYRAATGREPVQRLYVLLTIEVLITIALVPSANIFSLLISMALVIQVAIYLAARRPKD